jgi:hypothetical protein
MQGEWFDFKKLKPININDIIIMFNVFSDEFIYAQYKKKVNGNGVAELLSRTTWSQQGKTIILSNPTTTHYLSTYTP